MTIGTPPAPLDEDDWKKFLAETEAYAKRIQAVAQLNHGLGDHDKYFYQQDSARIFFHSEGIVRLCYDMQIVGSHSTATNSWLWSWANSSIDDRCTLKLNAVVDLGKKRGFPKLTLWQWSCDDFDGWEMTSCAALILQAKAIYRCPGKQGYLYCVLFDHTYPNMPLDDFVI